MVKPKNSPLVSVIRSDLCTGCGTCTLCPRGQVALILNEHRGIYQPHIGDNCNGCGYCLKLCPGKSVNFRQLSDGIFADQPTVYGVGHHIHCYTGQSSDSGIRFNASSGGIATQILICALDAGIIDGALVTRMSRENPLRPEPFIARTKEEIINASGSKYCPVPTNVLLKEVISSGCSRIAVVGLPCHIHGVRAAERLEHALRERIVLHIGLFCHATRTFAATRFQLKRMNIKLEDVDRIAYRGDGWPGYMTVVLKDGRVEKVPREKYYDSLFSSFTPWRCTTCIDDTAELADVSLGDAWLPGVSRKNNPGTSLIITRTPIGDSIVRQMADLGLANLESRDISIVRQSQKGLGRKRLYSTWVLLYKLMNKKAPIYDYPPGLPGPTVFSYAAVVSIAIRIALSSRERLWGLLKVYDWMLNRLKNVRRDH